MPGAARVLTCRGFARSPQPNSQMAANGRRLPPQSARSREIDLHTNGSPDTVVYGSSAHHGRGAHQWCDVSDFADILRSFLLILPQLTGNDGPPCVGDVVLVLSGRASID